MEYGHPLAGGPGPIGAGLYPIHRSAWNGHSRKFAVASDPTSPAPGTRERHGGPVSASKCGGLVAFVATFCSKRLQLATALLPKKFSPIGPGLDRTSC